MNPFISLLKTAITSEYTPISFINWNEVYSLAQAHNVNNLIVEAISFLPEEYKPSSEILAAFRKKLNHSIALEMNQRFNADEAISAFEAAKIPVIILKGSVMKKLYPRIQLRSMADVDIFMHEEDQNAVHEILMKQQYECVSFGEKKDNVYKLAPYTTIEMHKNLFMYEDDWNQYFCQIWERIELVQGYQHVYQMDKELFYVYMLAHMAKHLKDDGGIGVRAFLDLFIYREHYKDALDVECIRQDLHSLHLLAFAERAEKLSDMWFGELLPDEDYLEFGDYILGCGAYGNKDNFVMNNEVMRDDPTAGKWTYIWRRAFPSLDSMKVRAPKLQKYPILLPYYWGKRLGYSLSTRRDFIKGEIKSAGNIDRTRMLRIKSMYKEWGLD